MRFIILVGPLPPPFVGQSISFKMLTDEIKHRDISHEIINLSGKTQISTGKTTLNRVLEYLRIVYSYMIKSCSGKKIIYLTNAQSCNGFLRDFIIIWFAYFNGHKIVCHLKGGNYDNFYTDQPKWLRWIIRRTLLRVDNLLILSEKLSAMYDFEPRLKKNIHIVPNGLPFKLKETSNPKVLPANNTEEIQILYLSNLIESKGYIDVLEAVRILVKERGINVACHFYGLFLANRADDIRVQDSAHGRELFESFVATHRLQKNVFYCGAISGEEKIKVLRESHFFVLPTNYNNEGQPVSIIEAIAFGNVVISTNYRAIPDMVVHGESGFLVPYGQPQAITQAIATLANDPQRYQEMSKTAHRHFQRNFTCEAHLKRILHFLSRSI